MLATRVDGSSLAVFRIAMGLLILYEVYSFFHRGWISRYWIEPSFHFTYFGFHWIRPWPGIGMYVQFGVMGVAAGALAIGAYYRFFAIVLWLAFSYQMLLEQARYLNHFYAASLLLLLLAIMPAHAEWSVDRWRRRNNQEQRPSVPIWALWLLRFQASIIYMMAGIAKLNAD